MGVKFNGQMLKLIVKLEKTKLICFLKEKPIEKIMNEMV
jgi:hypothetical protein